MAILLSGISAGWYRRLICILTLFGAWGLKSNGILLIENSFTILINTTIETDSGLIFAGDASILIFVLTTSVLRFLSVHRLPLNKNSDKP